jgi:hypothetical protein
MVIIESAITDDSSVSSSLKKAYGSQQRNPIFADDWGEAIHFVSA